MLEFPTLSPMREKKRPNSKQPPWEPADDSQAASFGRWLRQQRELREISLREISETSKISLRYLEAFEEDRFDLLPAPVFANGFLRQYSRYVGLDPDDVVNRFLVARRGGEEPGDETASSKTRQEVIRRRAPRTWPLLLLIGLAAVVLLALVFALPVYLDSRAARQPPAPVVPPPPAPIASPDLPEPTALVEEPGAATVSATGAPIHVTLEFLAECWYESIVDGKTRTEEIRIQGETVEIEAQTSIDLKFGNAGGVSLSVNGKPYPLGAAAGEVKSLRLDLPSLGITPPAPGTEAAPSPAAPAPEAAPVP